MPQSFACTHCPARFGKHEKLQRHLLAAHHGELRLSPNPDCSAVDDILKRAVSTANAAFADLPSGSLCACVICGDLHKPFRNAMDLAQHLVAKHEPEIGDGLSTRVSGNVAGGVKSQVSDSGVAKSSAVDSPTKSKGGVKRKVAGDAGAKAGKEKVTEVGATKVNAVDTTKKRRVSIAGEVGASGTKPPITPKKKDVHQQQALRKDTENGIRLPKQATNENAPILDFTCFGGFAANSHRSYYRLIDR